MENLHGNMVFVLLCLKFTWKHNNVCFMYFFISFLAHYIIMLKVH